MKLQRIKNKGFTLLELLLVMAILAMAVAIIMPRLNSSELTLLRVQAREVIAVLNYARRTAIIQGAPQIATLYAYSDEKKIPKQVGSWVSRGAHLQWNNEKTSTESDDETKVPQYEVTFYPEGGCSGGELVLSNEKNQIKIMINPLTSKVISEMSDE